MMTLVPRPEPPQMHLVRLLHRSLLLLPPLPGVFPQALQVVLPALEPPEYQLVPPPRRLPLPTPQPAPVLPPLPPHS